jgi:hypothetical protein
MVLADRINDKSDEALYRKIKCLDIDPTAEIEAVVGYGSYLKFSKEMPVDVTHPAAPAEPDTAFLVSWDFLVPEDSDLTDGQLLDRAAKLSRQSEFRESRRSFHEWRRKLIARKVTMAAARDEMARCLAIYNCIVASAHSRTRTRTALQVAAVAAPLADLAIPGLGLAGGVAFGLGAMLSERLLPVPAPGPREKIAALVHDSREAFGWYALNLPAKPPLRRTARPAHPAPCATGSTGLKLESRTAPFETLVIEHIEKASGNQRAQRTRHLSSLRFPPHWKIRTRAFGAALQPGPPRRSWSTPPAPHKCPGPEAPKSP